MNNLPNFNGLERAQLGAALAAGYEAPRDYLTELRTNISLIRDIASQYCQLTLHDMELRVVRTMVFHHFLAKTLQLLPRYINDLKQGRCIEAFHISSGLHRNDNFWLWCDRICSNMEGQVFYDNLKNDINCLKSLLAESEKIQMYCEPVLFERFYFAKKQNYGKDGLRERFEEWMYSNLGCTIEKLRSLQAKVVADALKKDILHFAPEPSQTDTDKVQLDYLKGLLPYNYEMTEGFRVACAQWRQFIHWNDTILIIDYKKYGKYIQNHYYDFSSEQLKVIFELDMKLHLIHEEMARLNPELADILQPAQAGSLENTALFAPYNTIKRMLTQDWFDEVSTDKEKYTTTWRVEMVSELMKSDIGIVIAEEWQKSNKRQILKGAVMGGLKLAGVVKGSDLSIASAIVGGNVTDSKTFANYMGRGSKGDIANWICDYVKG